MLQKVLLHNIKASYAVMISCDKLIQKGGEFKKKLTPAIDSLDLLGTSRREINQLKRDLVKHKLPANMKLLAKDFPPGLYLLFGDDNRGYSRYNKYHHKSGKQKSSRNFKAPTEKL